MAGRVGTLHRLVLAHRHGILWLTRAASVVAVKYVGGLPDRVPESRIVAAPLSCTGVVNW